MYSPLLYRATLQKCGGSQVSKSCCTCNSELGKGTFTTFLQTKRSRCETLLRFGHLEDSEVKECTVIHCTEPPYKGGEAPRSAKVLQLQL